MQATAPNNFVQFVPPVVREKTVVKLNTRGSCDSPSFAAPGAIAPLRITVRNEHATSVSNPYRIPRGISLLGSYDSSAASGNCSIPRYNHNAKGRAANDPRQPFAGTSNAQRAKSTCGIAPIQNTASTASAASAINTENRNDSATPNTFIATNTA